MDTVTATRPVPDHSVSGHTVPDPAAPLTLLDRCDRCGSRAYVRATLPVGTALLFCGHHGNAHRAALLGVGALVHDETHRLTAGQESNGA